MTFFSLLKEATEPGDRWLMGLTALILLVYIGSSSGQRGAHLLIYRDNQPLLTLDLKNTVTTLVEGRLGPVRIEIKKGQARLLEYDSPRLIGTRTGWIQNRGEIAVCVPCGILIQIQGVTNQSIPSPDSHSLDGVAH